MQPQQNSSYQEITKELYSKNVDLVNANKTLELIQKLYEIMITSYSVESVSQKFIDTITQYLGFSDGIVVSLDAQKTNLKISGITQSQINKTILEVCQSPTTQVRFDINKKENILNQVYLSGVAASTHEISDIWTPYVKKEDLLGISSAIGDVLILVYPIIFGEKILGSFAVVIAKGSQEISEFEKSALEKLVNVFGIAIDRVTINMELKETQTRELEKARELLKLKDEFVFIATHDLKTPVTAISGFLDLIRETKEQFSADVVEDLNAIEESSDRLKQLTNDLLEVARSESGTIKVQVTKVDINKIIEKTKTLLSPKCTEKNINVEVTLDPSCQFVLADEPKLSEVVENLFSNAVKYNKDSGSVTIASNREQNSMVLIFADSGFGIPKDQQSKVFQKFFRAHQKGTEEVAGTGLGLFVVRMLVEKMGGEISFESTEGEGTTFKIILPLAT